MPALAADERFAVVPEWVLYADIPAGAVRLYATLRRYADRDGECYPSRATLAGRMRCSPDTVDRWLKALVVLGAVEVRHRTKDGGRVADTNLYYLRSVSPQTAGGSRKDAATGSRKDAATGSRKDAAENENQLNENQEPPPSESDVEMQIAAGFAAFWGAYPRKAAKDKARVAFRKRVLGTRKIPAAPVVEIIEGVGRFAADPNLPPPEEARFIPHPATWLNEGRWQDGPLPPRGSAPAGRSGSDVEAATRRLEDRLRAAGRAEV